jgi:RES domain-containing protein
MAKSIGKVAQDVVVKQIKCITDKRATSLMITGPTKDQLDYNLECGLGVSVEDIKKTNKLITAAWNYVKTKYTNPYVQGKATFFIASLVVPILGEAKVLKAEQVVADVAKTEPYLEDFVSLSKKLEGRTVEEAIVVLEEGEVVSTTTRSIVNTGDELKIYLNSLKNIPKGVTYEGDLIKSISKEFHPDPNPKLMDDWATNNLEHRFSKKTESGFYASETDAGNIIEMGFDKSTNKADYARFKFENVKIDNMLNLTDDAIRKELGVTEAQIKKLGDNKYMFTSEIATWARTRYKGIIYPGANPNGVYKNVVLFNQSDIDVALKTIKPIPIP